MRTPAAPPAETDTTTRCGSVPEAPLGVADVAETAHGPSAPADPVRPRVLTILAAAPEGEGCAGDFVGPPGKSQPTVPHHVEILSEAGLVHGDRRGPSVRSAPNRGRLAELPSTIAA